MSASIRNTTLRKNDGFGLYLARQAHLSAFDQNTLTENAAGPAQVGAYVVAELNEGNTYSGNDIDLIEVVGGSSLTHSQTWPALASTARSTSTQSRR